MAFDQSTRNRLQKFVSNARAILGEEFTRQLQATYGLDPKQGTVAAIDSLTHLDNRQRQTAHLLRETLAHYLATTPGKGEKDRTKQVLDRIVREQAFTVLNRLAALRMAEARGFLLESIAKAHSSKGFQLYRQLSGTAHGETGDAYRNYLFSLFDEFSLDLAVLFDRHSAQGRLFPRETALLELLAEINHHEIEHLWAEDETIGWIYQYFNSQEERKKMRAESQAPRNSRELAVRNQFFTPRYVVEFLTDNTLGRIWYEMTQGNTALVDNCRYLVRRPTEIFLKPGETAPEAETSDNEALSQEELLKQPVYIPHRPLKDPRSIRMLDPACGSMHFGLYAFDLFERIYLEAWQLEQQLGPDAFTREAGQQALQSTFDSLEAFKQQIPKLIIEHNIHGVDIDPRAVQIAGLSLWQRAQRAWHQQGIKPQQRPAIVKSNIVCAEPMPGEKALLQEFTSKLNPPVLGQLLETIFDLMQLAGEAGTLLKIEEEIQTAIHEAREQWLKQSGSNIVGDMFQAELDAATPQAKLGFDLRGVNDETFWDDAEQHILQALSDYADQAESNADQKRLFAEDAAKGFAFIDLCRKRFDVVLMNPPFGSAAIATQHYLKSAYPMSYYDLYSAFIDRMCSIMSGQGKVGSLTSKTFFSATRLTGLREWMLNGVYLEQCLDLGKGVLDSATVETAAYVISKEQSLKEISFFDLQEPEEKHDLSRAISWNYEKIYIVKRDIFLNFPNVSFSAYWGSQGLRNLFKDQKKLEPDYAVTAQGQATGDDFRFVRLRWESDYVPSGNSKWHVYAKGGTFCKYYVDWPLVVDWSEAALSKYKSLTLRSVLITKRAKEFSNKPLLTWNRVNEIGFNVRYLEPNGKFSDKGPAISPKTSPMFLLGILCSNFINKISSLQNPNRMYEVRDVSSMPISDANQSQIENYTNVIMSLKRKWSSYFESSSNYSNFPIETYNSDTFRGFFSILINDAINDFEILNDMQSKIDSIVEESFNLSETDKILLERILGASPKDLLHPIFGNDLSGCNIKLWSQQLISYFLGCLLGRWNVRSAKDKPVSPNSLNYIDAVVGRSQNNLAKGLSYKRIISGDDIDAQIEFLIDYVWSKNIVTEIMEILGEKSINDYTSRPSSFFERHLKEYSSGRRQAPIYWPLQTPSSSYTLWIYYHNLNGQTLYTCVNDFIDGPSGKLTQVEQDLNGLRSKSARSTQEEKELEKLSELASELRDFRDELLRLAKFWKPNLNDGVQITAAPLWKLFQHKAWQKKLKETWESLEKGDYDWAHLACTIWPERVLRKCHQDRSLAIAHDVEEHFWHEVEVPVKRGKKLTGETKLEWQPKDFNEAELTALVKKLAEEVK